MSDRLIRQRMRDGAVIDGTEAFSPEFLTAFAATRYDPRPSPQTAHLIALAALARDGDPDGAINASGMTDEAFVALMRSRYRP